MSVALKCDCCGALYEAYEPRLYNSVVAQKRDERGNAVDSDYFDLCHECSALMEAFLRGGDESAES